MGARDQRDQGRRRARSIRLALAGGGVVVTVAVAGVVQATSGAAASTTTTTTDRTPSVDAPDPGGFGQFSDGTDPGTPPGFLAPGDGGGGPPHGRSHGS